MEFDGTTFVLEIINFLVLVWLCSTSCTSREKTAETNTANIAERILTEM